MSFFDDFMNAIATNTRDEAGKAAADFLKDTTAEGTAFRADAEKNLNDWETQLAAGEIDQELLQSLVRGQFDMTVLAALNRAGKAGPAAKALGEKLIGLAVNTAIGMIPGGPVVQELAKIGVSVARTMIDAGVAGATAPAGGTTTPAASAAATTTPAAATTTPAAASAPAASARATTTPAATPATATDTKPKRTRSGSGKKKKTT